MKVSLEWLSEYIDFKASPAELAKALTMAGLEVEEIATKGSIPKGVVAAKILERKPHPNADKLSVCQVDPGSGTPVQIVCGAPNCDAGRTIPLATIGTVFDDAGKPFEIKKAKLRGVESFGMMCSAKELALSEDHGGLLILPEGTPLGKPVSELFRPDTVYTVEITPNRPDWLSHWGVARDIVALTGSSPEEAGQLHTPAEGRRIRREGPCRSDGPRPLPGLHSARGQGRNRQGEPGLAEGAS